MARVTIACLAIQVRDTPKHFLGRLDEAGFVADDKSGSKRTTSEKIRWFKDPALITGGIRITTSPNDDREQTINIEIYAHSAGTAHTNLDALEAIVLQILSIY